VAFRIGSRTEQKKRVKLKTKTKPVFGVLRSAMIHFLFTHHFRYKFEMEELRNF
jgi:hypothetical protein